MSTKTLRYVPVVLILVAAVPLSLQAKKERLSKGMLEKMDAVTCGAQQRGVAGLGTLWASAGITHVNSDEKLCPQYLLRTDTNEYVIRPTDKKHPVVLPVGKEADFKIDKNTMMLKVDDSSDKSMRTYEVVSIKPTNSDPDVQKEESSAPPALPPVRTDSAPPSARSDSASSASHAETTNP